MKKQILSAAVAAGLALGGLGFAGVAAAQYGGEQSPEPAVETQAQSEGIQTLQAEVEGENEDGRQGRGCGGLDVAAEAIGISEDELHAAVESGQSIADVAVANGVDAQVVIDAMVDARAERLADKVAEGRLTQAEADEKLANKADRIADRVNGTQDAGNQLGA